MIITIDGPAGTGKSTVALAIADALGFAFLDTGAMYRAVALEALRRDTDLDNARDLAFIAHHCRVEFDWSTHPPSVLLNDEDVTGRLRDPRTTSAASKVAAVSAVREQLVALQRRIGASRGDLVTEGRDQGTVVFPDAPLKFYLDASPRERARRRVAQLRERGRIVEFDDVLRDITERDHRDATRETGPLVRPPDALLIDTTSLTQTQVIDRIIDAVRQGQQA
jgi:cytidylate kinase